MELLLLRPRPHQELSRLLCGCAFFLSPADRRSRAGDAMEPTLRQGGEKKSAASENNTIKLGRIRPNRSPGIGGTKDTCCRAGCSWIDSSSAGKLSSDFSWKSTWPLGAWERTAGGGRDGISGAGKRAYLSKKRAKDQGMIDPSKNGGRHNKKKWWVGGSWKEMRERKRESW